MLTISTEHLEILPINELFAWFIDEWYLVQKKRIHKATGGQQHNLGFLKEQAKRRFEMESHLLEGTIKNALNQKKLSCHCPICRESTGGENEKI